MPSSRSRNRLVLSVLSIVAIFVLGAFPETRGASPVRLRVGTFDPLVERPGVPDRLRETAEPAAGYFLVQLDTGSDAPVEADLRAAGAEIVGFVPERSYIARVGVGGAEALRKVRGVRWVGAVEPGYKLSPDLGVRTYADPGRRAGGRLTATVDLYPIEDLDRAAVQLEALGIEVLHRAAFSDTRRLTVRATPAQLERAARVAAVSWIDEAPDVTLRNTQSRWVIQSGVPGLTPIWTRGLHGEGQILGHIDGPIYYKSCYFLDLEQEIPGPNHRKIVSYRAFGAGPAAHGTHTAGILAGDSTPVSGGLQYSGLAWAARIAHTDVGGITGVNGSPSNLYEFLTYAYQDGARLHSNSWGDDGTTAYTPLVRDIDLFSWDHEDSLVVFASSNSRVVHTPENAKNVLAVGATYNGTAADQFCSGGTGPTADGRNKPEIYAPGCDIISAQNQSLCGAVVLSGTSMAAPAITAAGALVRQYFTEGWYPSGTQRPEDARTPSGALMKAVLLNSAVDITGMPGYPGPQEGWGRLRLEDSLYFAGDSRKLAVLADVRNAHGLPTGVAELYSLAVGGTEPLVVTLVYTEPPAALLSASAAVNDLDLEVISPTGLRYQGNYIDSETGESAPGGDPDPINNVEMVRIASPQGVTWRVVVRGKAVNQGPQGYALVATGPILSSGGGTLRYSAHAIDDRGPLGNGDGFADPGETVTLSLGLLNLGQTTVGGASERLYPMRFDRAKVYPNLAAYADIPPGEVGWSLAPGYTVTISPNASCGELLGFRLRSTSAGGDESTFVIPVGAPDGSGGAVCQPLACPAATAVGVSPDLTAVVQSMDLQLHWPAVPGAAGYEIWRSLDRDFSSAERVGAFDSTEHIEAGELLSPESWYYRAQAVNQCGWSVGL